MHRISRSASISKPSPEPRPREKGGLVATVCACTAPQVILGNLDTTAILVRVIVGIARLNLARFTPVAMFFRWIAA